MYIHLLSTFLCIPFHRSTSQKHTAEYKSKSRACLLLIMLLCPIASYGAGLGRLAVNSALGQPFKAEIDLVAVKKEEKPSLTVRLAPQEIFRQANIDYVPLLSTFKTSIENRPDGQAYVKIISPEPVAEPLLNMLIELNWSSGRLLREYTVVLAPPDIDANPSVIPVTQPSLLPVSIKADLAASEKPDLRINSPVSGEKIAVPESPSITKAHTVYGPVKRGDTLGRIVRNIVPPAGVSFNQMLVALHRANRDAFFGNNMHRLKTGPILRVPDGNEIGSITPAEADKEVAMQTVDWNRNRLTDVVSSIPATEELKQSVTGKIEPAARADIAGARDSADGFLKLSQGKELPTADNAGGKDASGKNLGRKDSSGKEAGGVQEQIRAMEEDAIAKSKSLSEANERIALLEKNIKELQRLLELKNLALADMQQRAEAIKPHAATLSAPPRALSLQPELTPEPMLATQHSPLKTDAGSLDEAVTFPATVESATEIAKPRQVASKSSQESAPAPRRLAKNSLIDDLKVNIEYFGGALVLLITGIVGVSIIGRPKEESVADFRADRTSAVFDLPLHDKGAPAVVRTVANIAMQGDEANQASKAGTWLEASDTQTGKNLLDTSVENHGNPRTHEIEAIPRNAPVNPTHPSELVAPVSAYSASSIVRSTETGLEDLGFDLDGVQRPGPTEMAERNTHWHEIVTKLDLARAYQEMGDKDAAKQILQEVMREGDAPQQESAKLMLVNL